MCYLRLLLFSEIATATSRNSRHPWNQLGMTSMRSKTGIPSRITGRASVVQDRSLRRAQGHYENTLIDALYEVSYPRRPKYMPSKILRSRRYSHLPFQIRLSKGISSTPGLPHDAASSCISITHGSSCLTPTGVPVSQANELLGASYKSYRHTDECHHSTHGRHSLPTILHTVHSCKLSHRRRISYPRARYGRRHAGAPSPGLENVTMGEHAYCTCLAAMSIKSGRRT